MNLTLAYTAGYIDGDGCFYIGKNIKPIKYRRALIVSSSDKTICDFFKNEFGGNCSYNKKSIRFPTHKPIAQWYIQGESSEKLTESLVPYLIEKKSDAQKFLKFFDANDRASKDLLIKETKKFRDEENLVTHDIIHKINNDRF